MNYMNNVMKMLSEYIYINKPVRTKSLSNCDLSPCIHTAGHPHRRIVLVILSTFFFVSTKIIVFPPSGLTLLIS